VLTTMY